MDTDELLSRFAVALGIGLLIGLERGWQAREQKTGSRAAGFRTFAITGLLGGAVGALAQAAGAAGAGIVIGLGLAAFAWVIAVFSLEANREQTNFSATTTVAGILTFVLGAVAVLGDMRVAAAAAVAAAGVLALRESLHGWVKSLTWPELRSGLVLLAMTFIVLPIVPDDTIGPFGGVNPREVWLIAIVLAGVSFVGYAAVKYFGEQRGILLAAAAGGLVSSTAVTFANARAARAGAGAPRLLAAGVSLATAVSFLRVLAIVAVLQPGLLVLLVPPLAAAAAVAIGLALLWVYRGAEGEAGQASAKFRNPFALWSVIGLAITMGIIIVLGRFLEQYYGSTGAVVGAAALGLFDVDAVTVSMARLVPRPLTVSEGTFAILAAVASNTFGKLIIGASLGGVRFGLYVVLISVLALIAAFAALWPALLFVPSG